MSRRKQRWSVQVDEYPAPGERMYGPRTVVASHASKLRPGAVLGDQHEIVVGNTELDEIFIDGWLHIEHLGGRDYWMCVAGIDINVRVGKDGRAERVIYRVEGEPGVEIVEDA